MDEVKPTPCGFSLTNFNFKISFGKQNKKWKHGKQPNTFVIFFLLTEETKNRKPQRY